MKLNEKKISDFFKIINEKKIKSVFQPIVSLKTGEIVSFEALSRITLESCPINIEELFKIANMLEQSWKLDQLCRKCAIKASQQMQPKQFSWNCKIIKIESPLISPGTN